MLFAFLGILILMIAVSGWTIRVEAQRNQQEEWQAYIEEIADRYSICPELIEAIIEKESSWNPDAVNGTCTGLMQISSKWHVDRMNRLNVTDLSDPYDNILVGIDYLSELFGKYEDVGAVLMAYNGDSRLNDYLEDGNLSDYATGILERSAELERMHGK